MAHRGLSWQITVTVLRFKNGLLSYRINRDADYYKSTKNKAQKINRTRHCATCDSLFAIC